MCTCHATTTLTWWVGHACRVNRAFYMLLLHHLAPRTMLNHLQPHSSWQFSRPSRVNEREGEYHWQRQRPSDEEGLCLVLPRRRASASCSTRAREGSEGASAAETARLTNSGTARGKATPVQVLVPSRPWTCSWKSKHVLVQLKALAALSHSHHHLIPQHL